jgi:hypothetical protein
MARHIQPVRLTTIIKHMTRPSCAELAFIDTITGPATDKIPRYHTAHEDVLAYKRVMVRINRECSRLADGDEDGAEQ